MALLGQAYITNTSTPTLVATMPDPLGDTVSICVSNQSTSAALVTIWLVPSGTSTPANMHQVACVNLDGNCYMTKTPNSLSNGDQVFVLASIAGVSCTVMGPKN